MYIRTELHDTTIDKLGFRIAGASTFLCEYDTDVPALPTDTTIAPGSQAIVIESGDVWLFGPSRIWLKYKGVSQISC